MSTLPKINAARNEAFEGQVLVISRYKMICTLGIES